MSDAHPLKILLSAYACEPGRGSEHGVGWNWVRHLAKSNQVWVLTRTKSKPAIQAALQAEPLPNAHFIYIDLPRWASFWKSGRRGIYLYYYAWQWLAYLRARALEPEIHFDIAHHVTFVTYWMPSFIALLGVPFVWGPVGGGESAPPAFQQTFSPRGRFYERLRDVVRRAANLDPLVRLTARRSVLALATTPSTEAKLKSLGCRRTMLLSEAGICAEELQTLGALPAGSAQPFRIASMGNLLHWKGFELGLRAFALHARQNASSEYWIMGAGPEEKRLHSLASELGVANQVTFCGALPRHQALDRLAQCDALLHPSLHDSGGWVCLEAMASGRPVVCLDLGGPSIQVTAETGFKIAAHSPEQTVRDIASALSTLCSDRGLSRRLGEGGRRRIAAEFSWAAKCHRMAGLYHEILQPTVAASTTGRGIQVVRAI